VSERTLLLKLAPHIVRPMQFLVPAYRGHFPGRTALHGGLLLYDALAKFSAPGRHRAYRTKALLEQEPGLLRERLTGGVTYYDSATDDARLTLENILDARRLGADVLSYAQVIGVTTSGSGESERIDGVELLDLQSPTATARAQARVTVNATGPWADRLLGLVPGEPPAPLLRPTKGCHVVLDWARLPVQHAVVMNGPTDQRVIFAIPWPDVDVPGASRTIIGTTDTDFHGDPDRVATDAADVDYLLSCANHYFPQAKLIADDVLATWAGLRPLVMPDAEGLSASQVSREHRILSRPGLVTIVGGKLTTYRRMAAQVVDAAYAQLGQSTPPTKTAERPLPGAEGLLPAAKGVDPIDSVMLALQALAIPGLDTQATRHLARQYGMRGLLIGRRLQALAASQATDGGAALRRGLLRLDPELPFLMVEVEVAVQEEEALRLDDVLERRLPLLLLSRDQGLGCAEQVAQRMAELLGWSPDRTAAELAEYRDVVAQSRAFRSR
jgi:glycerol-3-phosphate dehydrogenase